MALKRLKRRRRRRRLLTFRMTERPRSVILCLLFNLLCGQFEGPRSGSAIIAVEHVRLNGGSLLPANSSEDVSPELIIGDVIANVVRHICLDLRRASAELLPSSL